MVKSCPDLFKTIFTPKPNTKLFPPQVLQCLLKLQFLMELVLEE